MRTEQLHWRQKVRHPQYGVGIVLSIRDHAAEIEFDGGVRTVSPESSGLEPAEPQFAAEGLTQPLKEFVRETVAAVVEELDLPRPEQSVPQLGTRWLKGRLVMHPTDPALQAKEVPIETFFHKIVMMRDKIRVLEQKVNSNPRLTDADKVELQQYITAVYGSMTTFNVLFREKEGQF